MFGIHYHELYGLCVMRVRGPGEFGPGAPALWRVGAYYGLPSQEPFL